MITSSSEPIGASDTPAAAIDGLPNSIPSKVANSTRAVARPQILALTGLRFVAAFSVLVAHAVHWIATVPSDYTVIVLLGEASGLGMPLFFVLSGFVIHYNYGHYFSGPLPLPAFTRFMIARFARLYPLYVALLLIYFWQRGVNFWEVGYIGRFLTLTQAWQPLYSGPTWVGHLYLAPAWSISVEWFLYIFYGLVGVRLLQFKTMRGSLTAFAVVAAIYYAGVVIAFRHSDFLNNWTLTAYAADVRPQHALFGWVFNTGPIGRWFEFTFGMLAAQVFFLKGPLNEAQQRIARWIMYVALLMVFLIYVNPLRSSLVAFGFSMASFSSPFIAIILFACASAPSVFSKVMGSRPAVVLGDASYSIYLLHALVLPMFALPASVAAPSWYWVWQMSLSLAVVLLLSLLTYKLYESPARRGLRYALGGLWKICFPPRTGRGEERWMSPTSHAALAVCCITAFLWVNRPDIAPKIQILEANYGANHENTVIAPPFTNTYKRGNATMAARQDCLHSDLECEYTVNLIRIGGDPVHGMAKDYSVEYRCANEGQTSLTAS
jgi:peptidoglycan/LPS O-acetylase OafA/YrhL